MSRLIIRNSARCLDCDIEVVSKHRHDFQSCPCGRVAVDGGTAYARRLIGNDARWQDTSIIINQENDDDVG